MSDLVKEKAVGASSIREFVSKLQRPRATWLMIPAGLCDSTIAEIAPFLETGDILIDGGAISYYIDDIRRAKDLALEGHSLCRCGNQRWRVGAGARLLHDDRWPGSGRYALDLIFLTIAPASVTYRGPRDARSCTR